jgi:hypothetical protein
MTKKAFRVFVFVFQRGFGAKTVDLQMIGKYTIQEGFELKMLKRNLVKCLHRKEVTVFVLLTNKSSRNTILNY